MFRFGTAGTAAALTASLLLFGACGGGPRSASSTGDEFAELQARGEMAMGVDQYASTHVFDALPDGGRIEFQVDGDDENGVAAIREHMKEIKASFEAGDFGTPAFIHDREVPGTDVMAARRASIEYRYRDLPRGGELRLVTTDPQALEAIREFMAFQRMDHRAAGMDHGGTGHEGTNDEGADHEGADHEGMDHGGMDHGAMGPAGGMHVGMGGGDEAFAADMDIVHELLTNHRAITRTVEHLPDGIRTLTESSSPAIAALIVSHVASMERRLEAGDVFNLFSPTLPVIFEEYDRIRSSFEYTSTGVAIVQTSDDPELVKALQDHAAEVTEMVDEGMIVMMRGMMEGGRMRPTPPGSAGGGRK